MRGKQTLQKSYKGLEEVPLYTMILLRSLIELIYFYNLVIPLLLYDMEPKVSGYEVSTPPLPLPTDFSFVNIMAFK